MSRSSRSRYISGSDHFLYIQGVSKHQQDLRMSNATCKDASVDDVLMVANDDMMIEILSRLPTKSLHRFKCVSKPWNTFISHVISRRRTLLPMSGLYINRFVKTLNNPYCDQICRVFTWRVKSLPVGCKVIHSSNGLFLFTELSNGYNNYYVWNPATEEFVTLPPELPLTLWGASCCLAFDPRKSLHFKVIRILVEDYNHNFVRIYSSTTGRWTGISPPFPVPIPAPSSAPVFHKGALYYLTNNPTRHHCCFDINNGSFRLIKLPYKRSITIGSWIQVSRGDSCIGESRGDLYHAHVNAQKELKIYVLDKSKNKWALTHQTNTAFQNHGGGFCQPVAFHPESEIVYLNIQDRIAIYNPCSKVLEAHGIRDYIGSRSVFPVTPLLESINPPGGKFFSPSVMEGYTPNFTNSP